MIKDTEVPAWQALEFARDDMDAIGRNMTLAYGSWWTGPPASPDEVETWASDACREGMCVFAMGSIGYNGFGSPLNDWREVGRRVVAAVVHYFFGPWRDRFEFFGQELDREKARAELAWSSYYREGLAVAMSLSDWASADRLLEWPGADLRFDEGMDDRTREDNAYQIWLASRLRGESVAAAVPQRDLIESGSRRRPKMLLAAAEALLDGDATALGEALTMYLRQYRKQEMRPNRVDFGVCIDATILWHLARRRGLGEISLPSDVMILIARP